MVKQYGPCPPTPLVSIKSSTSATSTGGRKRQRNDKNSDSRGGRRRAAPALLLLLLSLLHAPPTAHADTYTTSISESSYYSATLWEDFGLAAGGQAILDVEMQVDDTDAGARGLLALVGEATKEGWYDTLIQDAGSSLDDGVSPTTSVTYEMLYDSPAAGRILLSRSTPAQRYVLTAPVDERYSVYFLLCSSDQRMSVKVTSTLVNPSPSSFSSSSSSSSSDGTTTTRTNLTQYLPMESVPLPVVYTCLGVVYLLLTLAWALEMRLKRQHVTALHKLILAASVLKTLASGAVALFYRAESEDREGAPEAIRRVGALLYSYADALFLFVVLLISLGWCVVRSTLTDREGRSLRMVMVLYLCIVGLSSGCLPDEGGCSTFMLLEYVIRSLLMLCTVVATNVNLTSIRASIQVPWTATVALEYRKMRQYHAFRWTFLLYLVLPTVLLLVLKIYVLSWQLGWVYVLVEEFMRCLIYVHVAATFAPFDPALLTRAFDNSLQGVRN